MSHHSSESDKARDEFAHKLFGALMPSRTPLHDAMQKAFGEYPDGKLGPSDAGAVVCEIGEVNGRVVMRFPKPVVWIGFTGDEAMLIAQSLIDHARAVGLTKPLTITL